MADSNLVNQAVEKVLEMCPTDKMSKADAKDFLEDVVSQLEASIEALDEEMDEGKEEDC